MVQQPTMGGKLGLGLKPRIDVKLDKWCNNLQWMSNLVWGFKFQHTTDVKFGLMLEPIMDVKLGMGHKPTMDDNLWGFKPTLHF
jgi:hypothetical protein